MSKEIYQAIYKNHLKNKETLLDILATVAHSNIPFNENVYFHVFYEGLLQQDEKNIKQIMEDLCKSRLIKPELATALILILQKENSPLAKSITDTLNAKVLTPYHTMDNIMKGVVNLFKLQTKILWQACLTQEDLNHFKLQPVEMELMYSTGKLLKKFLKELDQNHAYFPPAVLEMAKGIEKEILASSNLSKPEERLAAFAERYFLLSLKRRRHQFISELLPPLTEYTSTKKILDVLEKFIEPKKGPRAALKYLFSQEQLQKALKSLLQEEHFKKNITLFKTFEKLANDKHIVRAFIELYRTDKEFKKEMDLLVAQKDFKYSENEFFWFASIWVNFTRMSVENQKKFIPQYTEILNNYMEGVFYFAFSIAAQCIKQKNETLDLQFKEQLCSKLPNIDSSLKEKLWTMKKKNFIGHVNGVCEFMAPALVKNEVKTIELNPKKEEPKPQKIHTGLYESSKQQILEKIADKKLAATEVGFWYYQLLLLAIDAKNMEDYRKFLTTYNHFLSKQSQKEPAQQLKEQGTNLLWLAINQTFSVSEITPLINLLSDQQIQYTDEVLTRSLRVRDFMNKKEEVRNVVFHEILPLIRKKLCEKSLPFDLSKSDSSKSEISLSESTSLSDSQLENTSKKLVPH